MSYLTDKFKGVYRLKVPIDKNTNDFPRKPNGQYEDIDMYISCQHGNMIFHDTGSTLLAYIPSLQRGHNIINTIQEENLGNVYDIEESDSEVLFKFLYDDSDKIIALLKPRTSGANISPFSARNKKEINYNIPEYDLKKYKDTISKLKDIIYLSKINNIFLKEYLSETELKLYKSIRMKPLYYIHSIGKFDDYISFIREEINKY